MIENATFHISPIHVKSIARSLAESQMKGKSMTSPAMDIGTTGQPQHILLSQDRIDLRQSHVLSLFVTLES